MGNQLDSWIIIEPSSNGGTRLKLFQTQLVANGSGTAASHFILTYPNSPGDNILLDDVYFHTVSSSSESIFNDNPAIPDTYYIGGTVVSKGYTPNGAWTALPTALVGLFDHWSVDTVDPTA